jgi:hypothetical protein
MKLGKLWKIVLQIEPGLFYKYSRDNKLETPMRIDYEYRNVMI